MTSDGRRSFTYSSENRLLTASGGVALGYDPLGRLATIASGNAPAIELGYDGLDVIAEYNPAGTLLCRYVHGPGQDEPPHSRLHGYDAAPAAKVPPPESYGNAAVEKPQKPRRQAFRRASDSGRRPSVAGKAGPALFSRGERMGEYRR